MSFLVRGPCPQPSRRPEPGRSRRGVDCRRHRQSKFAVVTRGLFVSAGRPRRSGHWPRLELRVASIQHDRGPPSIRKGHPAAVQQLPGSHRNGWPGPGRGVEASELSAAFDDSAVAIAPSSPPNRRPGCVRRRAGYRVPHTVRFGTMAPFHSSSVPVCGGPRASRVPARPYRRHPPGCASAPRRRRLPLAYAVIPPREWIKRVRV